MRAGMHFPSFLFFLLKLFFNRDIVLFSYIVTLSRFLSLIEHLHLFAQFNRVICGITEDTQQYHIIRAALEAVCFQTRDILEAMVKDSGTKLTTLQVDGGMTVNDLLMQLQADLTGIAVGK